MQTVRVARLIMPWCGRELRRARALADDERALRRLILDRKLAPCYPGADDPAPGSEECPICMLVRCLSQHGEIASSHGVLARRSSTRAD